MAPVIIGLTNVEGLSTLGLVSIILPLTLILTVGLIQPAKGAIIALQWWFGMHGFKQERPGPSVDDEDPRSEEHTSELQSLMRISYAVFCLKKKTRQNTQ